jgi:O-antigen/teichoic acid export membrane protein
LKFIQKIADYQLVQRSLIASVDQALLSGLNFLISIVLIKSVSKVEFGYYSIALPISLFLISLQNAMVNTPLTVLLANKKDEQKHQYIAALGIGQFWVIIPAALSGLLVFAALRFFNWDATQSAILAALSLASIGLLFREFTRTCYFAKERPMQVLKLDLFYVLIFLITAANILLFARISVPWIFLLLGFSGFLVALFFNRNSGWKYNHQSVKESYRENWKYGRWSLVGVLITHVQSYSYLYLLGLFAGSVAVADVSASRLLMMPLILLQAGWAKIILPYGARLRENNQNRLFFKKQVWISMLFTIATLMFVGALFLCSGLIKQFLFSEKYATVFEYLGLWGAVFIIRFLNMNASYGLQVLKKFDLISKANFVTMLTTLIGAWFLIQNNGIRGGLIALIIGESFLAILLWVYFARAVVTRENWQVKVLGIVE